MGKIIHKFAENIAFDRSGEAWQDACLAAFKEAKEKNLSAKDQDQIKKALTAAPLQQLPTPLKFGDNRGAEFHFNFPHLERPGFAYVGTVDLLSITPAGILQITDYKSTRKYAFKDAVAGYEGDTQFSYYYYIFQMSNPLYIISHLTCSWSMAAVIESITTRSFVVSFLILFSSTVSLS